MDTAAEIDKNPVSKYLNGQADGARDGRTRLARPNSDARTGTGKYTHFLCSADHDYRIGNVPG